MIEVNRSSIIIRDVDFESASYKKFEKAFSVYNSVTHKYEYPIYTIVNDDVHIPATVGSAIVQSFFTSDVVVENYANSPNADTISFSMIHEPLNDLQYNALSFLKTIKNDKFRHRMLNLGTGKGKTYVSISTISYLQQKAIVIVDKVDLAEQWKTQILFHTDIKEDEILILSGRESIEHAIENKNKYKIFIAIHATLNMLLSEDLNSINSLMHKLKIGVRIFDECHVNFKNMCDINSLSNVNYTIYLTATPHRSDYKQDILYLKVFDRVPSFNGVSETDTRYHTVVLCNFDSHPTDKQKMSVKTKYGFSLVKWGNFLATDTSFDYYKDSLLKVISNFHLVENNKKFAIILPTIELIDKTHDKLSEVYPDIQIGKFIGTIPKNKRADELAKPIIVTTEKIFGKAIDVSDLDCIINYVQISSQVNIKQILGRLRNNSGHSHVMIDMTDTGYIECIGQQKARKRFYKKCNTIKKIVDIK